MRARNVFLTLQAAGLVLAAPSPQASGEPVPSASTSSEPVAEPTQLPVDLETPLLTGNPEDALQAMQALDEAAFQQIQEQLAEAEEEDEGETSPEKRKKRSLFGGCTLSKLQVRREWYVYV